MTSSPRTARDVLVERAAHDVRDSMTHLQKRLAAESKGAMLMLEKVVFGLVRLVNPERRMTRDVDHLLSIAARHRAGEDALKLAKEHVEGTLRMAELGLVARVKEPEFRRVLDVAERIFAHRLPDFERMAAVEAPLDYDDLVRRAFPDRAHVDRIVSENARDVLEIIAHLEAHPHLLRVPRSWVPKLAHVARDMIAWKVEEVTRGIDVIYAPRTREGPEGADDSRPS